MLDKRKYDPEDLESLMLNKSFDELYEEEKRFVLRHTASAEEYESLRATLLMINDRKDDSALIAPRKGMKQDLMAEYATERRRGFWIWLNGILPVSAPPQRRQFAMALAALAPILIVAGLWYYSPDDGRNIAETKPAEEKVERETPKQETQTPSAVTADSDNEETAADVESEQGEVVIEIVEDDSEIEIEAPAEDFIAVVRKTTEVVSDELMEEEMAVDATDDELRFDLLEDTDEAAENIAMTEDQKEKSDFSFTTEEATPQADEYKALADMPEAEIGAARSKAATTQDVTSSAPTISSTVTESMNATSIIVSTLNAKDQGIDFDELVTAL